MWEQGGDSVHYTSPPQKQLTPLGTAPCHSYLGGLSHHSQPPGHFGEM